MLEYDVSKEIDVNKTNGLCDCKILAILLFFWNIF